MCDVNGILEQDYKEEVVNHLVFPNPDESMHPFDKQDYENDSEWLSDIAKTVGEAAMSHEQARQLVQLFSSEVSDGFKLNSDASYVANRIRELAVE